MLKPALRLMTYYRLVIEEIKDAEVITSYTRWVDAVQVRGARDQEVYLTFSPHFEHIWLESKKRLLEYVARPSSPDRSIGAGGGACWDADLVTATSGLRVVLASHGEISGSEPATQLNGLLAEIRNFHQRKLAYADRVNAATGLISAFRKLGAFEA